MRILILVARDIENPFLGGAEYTIWEWAQSLLKAGHRIEIITSTFPGSSKDQWIRGIHVSRLAPERTLGWAAFLAYERSYRGRVDAVIEDILGGSRLPFFAPLYVREPIISIWHQDPLPIFRNQYPRALIPALVALHKLLVRVHNDQEILVPSEGSKRDLVREGIAPRRVWIYQPGIAADLLGIRDPPTAKQRSPTIVCLGKIRRYKCAHHAILGLAGIASSIPNAKLVVVGRKGEASYLNELERLVDHLGLNGRVTFEVGADDARKMSLLLSSRALVSPAPVEGFGLAVIEAGACGLPVVGTDGIPEDALIEGVNGFRVPFGDITALGQRLGLLLTDDPHFNSLSRSAYSFAQAFTLERAAKPLLELIHRLDT